ncbi:4Fe-4S dicluster domain-containing protein [Thermus filiformis]|uniref:(4Fe-4S)-binding protein n=1 Tax=Thermus filiformis TaxID=276 RepID=A0A0A2WQJ8_THEFI|nr:4Fe-4S dicluster domain-containing protein [Thermus filiformis]KGQ21032.1 (4Fe-4S)-binding protein [Thermus filiformis]
MEKEPLGSPEDRRRFLSKMASAIFASMVAPGLAQGVPSAPPASEPLAEDALLRMQKDLERALQNPNRRWGMVIDLRKCVGCHACTVSCMVENRLPPGVVYRPVTEEEVGTYPQVTYRFVPRPCMQCDDPPCVPACPYDATWKRKDGIVEIDYELCVGCEKCIPACPYGSRHKDEGEYWTQGTPGQGKMPYENLPVYEWGKKVAREDEAGPMDKVRKCHFCLHRIERGLLPQCVVTCIGRATYFGDLEDPTSLVAELARKPNAIRLKEEAGTKPRVYYLV